MLFRSLGRWADRLAPFLADGVDAFVVVRAGAAAATELVALLDRQVEGVGRG